MGRGRAQCPFRTAVQTGRVGLWTWSPGTGEGALSPGWKRELGYSESELLDELAAWESLIHPEDLPYVRTALAEFVAERTSEYRQEFRVRRADGSWRSIVAEAELVRDRGGAPVRVVGTYVDVTEQERSVAEIARTNRALRMLIDANQALIRAGDEASLLHEICRIAVEVGGYVLAWIGLADPPGSLRVAAHAGLDAGFLAETELAASPASPGGLVAAALSCGAPRIARDIHADPAFASRREAARARGYNSAIALPLRAGCKACGVLKIYSSAPDAFDADEVALLEELANDLALGLGSLRARAERDRAIVSLRAAELQLRSLTDSVPDFLARFDTDGRFVLVNGAIQRTAGVSPDAVLGRTPLELGVCARPADNVALQESLARVARDGAAEQLEIEFATAAGAVPYEVRHIPEKDATGRVVSVLGIGRDLSERRAAEAALRESEELYRSVVTAMAEGVVFQNQRGEITAANPAAERITGYRLEDGVARPPPDVGAVRVDGSPYPLEDHPASITLRTGEPRSNEVMGILRPAGERVWISINSEPLRRPGEPRPYAVVSTFQDVSQRRRLEEELRQAQKMEAVGRLAGGVAHDFNNLLAVVRMQSGLLLSQGGLDPETREGLGEIVAATERAANLTRQLLTFSRRQPTRPVDLDLGEAVGGTVQLLRRVLGEDITLEARFAASLPVVHADPIMVEQVVMNLAINARDAMPGGGRLRVELDLVEVDERRAASHPGVRPGPHVRLAVTDTGPGIAAGHLPHVFEPFFTTKEVGEGTGLGLATVFGIVQQHQGIVEAQSTLGEGARFEVLLPAACRTGAAATRNPPPQAIRGGSETILVVEDEAPLRTVTRRVLERLGYHVLEASSASSARAAFEASPRPVDLLLTDLLLPGGISGGQLAEELLSRRPDLRVLCTSGYSEEVVQRQPVGRWPLLQKPYGAEALAVAVRRRLDAGLAGGE